MERVLSIFLPLWDVQRVRRRGGKPRDAAPDRPLILALADARQERVAHCCPRCLQAGVRPGMNLAEARALVGRGLVVIPHDPARSLHGLHLLARWAARFSPLVCVDHGGTEDNTSDGLLLDVTGIAHLFGGEHLFLSRIATHLQHLGFSCRLTIAPTIGAAWALARFGREAMTVVDGWPISNGPLPPDGGSSSSMDNRPSAMDPFPALRATLGPLPLAALRLPATICDTLKPMGLECIEHLLRLPRQSLAQRFGATVLLRLDQAFGRVPELLIPRHTLDTPAVKRILDTEGGTGAIDLEGILAAIRDMLDELCARLATLECGARGLRLQWRRFNAPPVTCDLLTTRATRDPVHLWKLLHPGVRQMHLGYGVEAMTLSAFWIEKIRHHQEGIWEPADSGAREFDAFLDTVANRWGTQRVLRPAPVASHVPETARGFARIDAEKSPLSPAVPQGLKTSPPIAFLDRPTFLFDTPEPADVLALQPDRPPSRITWRGCPLEVFRGSGPERIVTPWWRVTAAGAAVPSSTRHYYKLETQAGWLWVFRELRAGKWYVHGTW